MATINGTAINFGFTGTGGIAITGVSGILLQSAEQTKAAEMEKVKNGVGDDVSHAWYNIHDEAELEYIASDSASIATAITNTALQTPGTILSITACANMPTLVGTNWEVQSGCKISGSNVNAKRIRVPIHKYSNITAAAGA